MWRGLFFLSPLLLLLLHAPFLASSAAPSASEQIFLDATSAEGAREHLRAYTSAAHMAGTQGDYDTAVYTQQALESYGLQTEMQPFRALLNYPVSRSLRMTAPVEYTAELSEAVYPEDATSDTPWRNLTFHGYGASGDVEAELVYANYGSAADFAHLASLGVDVRGKVVIVRYGAVFRGLKVQNAQYAGAAGVLIYSDPADDGYSRGQVYPEGPFRPESGVQRGSVQFLSRCSGDPAFVERDPSVCGYPTEELIPTIPSLPLSYGDALPLLEQLSGPSAPASWVGGLPIPYALGPGPARVHLSVEMDYQTRTMWNLVATIPGAHPDPVVAEQIVLLGNHRDAWVFGATDPSSGSAAFLELARGLGALLSSGWRPSRTLLLASWDGEEYGLLGSVHFAEKHAPMLQRRAVAYLNVDVAVRGSNFSVEASPALAEIVRNVAADVPDPAGVADPSATDARSVLDAWEAQAGGATVGRLGSGSDFAPFLHHLGIASLDMTFDGAQGVYHSTYDSFLWMSRFGDPTFAYHRGIAQLWGLLTIRLASDPVLLVRADHTAQALVAYQAEARMNAVKEGLEQLDWGGLSSSIAAVQAPSAALERFRALVAATDNPPASVLRVLNVGLATLERSFLIAPSDGFAGGGLPGRPWFKHVLQAPGINTGYGAAVFPSLSDAISARNATAAQEQLDLLAAKFARVSLAVSALLSPCLGRSARACMMDVNASSCAWFVPMLDATDGGAQAQAWDAEPLCVAGFDPCAQRLAEGFSQPAGGAPGVFLPNVHNLCRAPEVSVATPALRVLVLIVLLSAALLWIFHKASTLPSFILWCSSIVLLLAVSMAISVDPARVASQRSAAEAFAIAALVVGLVQLQDVLTSTNLKAQLRSLEPSALACKVLYFIAPLLWLCFALPLGLVAADGHRRSWSLAMSLAALAVLALMVRLADFSLARAAALDPSRRVANVSTSIPASASAPTTPSHASRSGSTAASAGGASGFVHGVSRSAARSPDGHQLLQQHDEEGGVLPSDVDLHDVQIHPPGSPEPPSTAAADSASAATAAGSFAHLLLSVDFAAVLLLLAMLLLVDPARDVLGGKSSGQDAWTRAVSAQMGGVLVLPPLQDAGVLGGFIPSLGESPSAEERACGVIAFLATIRAIAFLLVARMKALGFVGQGGVAA